MPGKASAGTTVRTYALGCSCARLALLIAFAACAPAPGTLPAGAAQSAPRSAAAVDTIALRTDREEYVARFFERQGQMDFHAFEVVVTLANTNADTVHLPVCGVGPRMPMYSIQMVTREVGRRESAYNPNWACVGTDDRIAVAPGASRTDTVHLRGPTGWSGHRPLGSMTGRMALHYYRGEVCRAGACRALRIWSNPFEVQLEPAPIDTMRPGPGHPRYRGFVRIHPERGSLDGTWFIEFVPDSSMRDSVVLLLNSGLRATGAGGTLSTGYTQGDDGDVVIRFRAPLDVDRVASLSLSVEGSPTFGEDGINRIGPEWVELGLDSEWHPVFAGYGQQITGTVNIALPAHWESVASGSFHRSGEQRVLRNDVPLIDLAFSAAPVLDSATAERATVYFVEEEPRVVTRILESADGCARYLNERYGARGPLPHAKIVLAPRSGPGYARQNYIVITDAAGFEEVGLAHFLCHELAHYWSSGAQPMSPDNWLNEAFAEYIAGRYVRARFGADAYASILARWEEAKTGTPPIWTPGATSRPGPRVAYRKAPWLLHRFEERIGADRMDAVLRAYMHGRLATTPDLLAAIARVAGPEEERWFRTELAR